jgi:hypothetical protein
MSNTIKRHYGKERSFGDVFFNKSTKKVSASLNFGFTMGTLYLVFKKNKEDGGFDLFKEVFTKDGEKKEFPIGRAFKRTKSDGGIVDGQFSFTIPLTVVWDKETQKELSSNNDAIYLKMVQLKERKSINDDVDKIAFITGQFGIEINDDDFSSNTDTKKTPSVDTSTSADDIDDDDFFD